MCLPTSQTCPLGAASSRWPWKEDTSTLWGHIQHCHTWHCQHHGKGHHGMFGWWLESATTFWMQEWGHCRSIYASIYGDKPCPFPIGVTAATISAWEDKMPLFDGMCWCISPTHGRLFCLLRAWDNIHSCFGVPGTFLMGSVSPFSWFHPT